MKKIIRPFVIVSTLLIVLIICIWGLGGAFTPLILSFFAAYLLFPIITKLESKGINRNIVVSVVFVILAILVLLFCLFALPPLIKSLINFSKDLPQALQIAINKIEAAFDYFNIPLDINHDNVAVFIKQHVSDQSGIILSSAVKALEMSFTGIASWLISIINLFLIPVFFFYVINDYEKISREIKSFIPQSVRKKVDRTIKHSNTILSGYIRGQLMVALILSILYAIGLSLVGIKFGLVIGILSGFISIIPYAGFFIGFLTSIIMALANYTGLGPVIGVIAVFTVVQLLESFVITPRLVGNKVGLSALATMIALIIGGNLFGLMGMLIAIPVAAILKSLIKDLKNEYQQLHLYQKR